MSQTIIHAFQNCKGGNRVKTDGGAKLMVVLTIMRNVLSDLKTPIGRFGGSPFAFIFVVLSFLAAQFALIRP